jgi:hypothetical protein
LRLGNSWTDLQPELALKALQPPARIGLVNRAPEGTERHDPLNISPNS